jgi:hypothetical protein
MPIFRHQALLLEQAALTDQPVVGRALRVRPHDGDAQGDHDQAWRVFVDLHREGAGLVAVELWTSFDHLGWARVGRVLARTVSIAEFLDLPAFGPYLQVRTALERSKDSPLPQHTATVRLASDGPFSVAPV